MNRRQFLRIVAAGMTGAAMSACGQQGSQPSSAQSGVQDRVNKIVASMTTEQKLAQMMIVSLRSDPDNTNLPQEVT